MRGFSLRIEAGCTFRSWKLLLGDGLRTPYAISLRVLFLPVGGTMRP